jgi:hypothetical protein
MFSSKFGGTNAMIVRFRTRRIFRSIRNEELNVLFGVDGVMNEFIEEELVNIEEKGTEDFVEVSTSRFL